MQETDSSTTMTTPETSELQRYNQAIRFFIYGQAGFYLALFVCVLLLPRGLVVNHGFTYYGENTLTMIPFGLAFLTSGVFTLASSLYLPRAMPFRMVKIAFWLMIPLLLAIMLTTSSVNMFLNHIHLKFGEALFILQAVMCFWMGLVVCRNLTNYLLLLLLVISGVVSIVAVNDIIPYLIEGQVAYQLVFGLLVVHTMSKLRERLTTDN